MGLLFHFPTDKSDPDHAQIEKKGDQETLKLRSYGLPPVFWLYLLAILGTITVLFFAIQGPIKSVLEGQDQINLFIVYVLIALFIGIPLTLLSLFFYEKILAKDGHKLQITHKIFWIPLRSKVIKLKSANSFVVQHHLDSPNVARIENQKEFKAFQNRGYFQLYAQNDQEHFIQIDR
ncbi:MAG: hypothetical protein ACPGJV_15690, partial [Bacteriovoracaceae bacterium]